MPSFSAKLYEIMNIKYDEEAAKFLQKVVVFDEKDKKYFIPLDKLVTLIPDSLTINEPLPLFKNSIYYF